VAYKVDGKLLEGFPGVLPKHTVSSMKPSTNCLDLCS
jgi:hypothetical protein